MLVNLLLWAKVPGNFFKQYKVEDDLAENLDEGMHNNWFVNKENTTGNFYA